MVLLPVRAACGCVARAASARAAPRAYMARAVPLRVPPARALVTPTNVALDEEEEAAKPRRGRGRGRKPKKTEEGEAAPKKPRRSRKTKAEVEATPTYTAAPLHTYEAGTPLGEPQYCFEHLPHPSQWRNVFSFTREQNARYRYFVSNRALVHRIVDQLGLNDQARRGQKATIVEAYSGPGTLTRGLIQHESVEKVIALENVASFLPWLQQLKEDPSLDAETRGKLSIIPESGFSWDTYETLVNEGHLDHLRGRVPNLGEGAPPLHWEEPSPIYFVAQLPNTVHGEQLFAQLVHAIASGFWLFKYGRVKMAFVCGEAVAARSLAQVEDHRNRAKLGVTVQSLAAPTLTIPTEQLQPYAEYFYPPTPIIGPRVPLTSTFIPNSNISSGLSKQGLCMLVVDPLQQPLVDRRDLDAFEFLLRNLFVLKTKPIGEALKHVAPGAANVLKMLAPGSRMVTERPELEVSPDAPVYSLSNEQWAALANVFERWPFRPQNLFEEGRVQRGKNADNQFF